MGINLANYEQYFLDHTEGNLSPEMERELSAFLEAHPELKPILEDFDAVTLVPDEPVIYHPKESLKKNIQSSLIIHEDNLEKMMISSVEGLLNNEEEAALQEYLRLSPAMAREFEFFRKTRIPVDPTIKYPYKNDLKKKAGLVFMPRLAWGIAAAAAVILIFLAIRIFNKVEEIPSRLLVEETPEIPAVTPEEPRKEIPADQQKSYAVVPNDKQIDLESQEHTIAFRMEVIQEASSIPGPKKYSIHRLKKRPVPKLQTIEPKEPSLLAKLTDKVINKTGQNIRENIPLDEISKPRLNFWAVLSTGIKGYNKISDREIELFVYKNDEGKVSSYALIEYDRLILNRELNID